MSHARHAVVLIAVLLAACAGASPADSEPARDRLPRRADADAYVAMLERPERAAWQKVDELVESLDLAPGSTVADVGAGSGYFVAALARAVGPTGRVVAEDIDSELVAHLRERIERESLTNVEARLGDPDDPHLEAARYDLALMVDTYHHVARPDAFLPNVRRALRPGGRLVIVDFPPGDHVPTNVAHPTHRLPPARVAREARAAGFELAVERLWPPYQFIVELCAPPCSPERPQSD